MFDRLRQPFLDDKANTFLLVATVTLPFYWISFVHKAVVQNFVKYLVQNFVKRLKNSKASEMSWKMIHELPGEWISRQVR